MLEYLYVALEAAFHVSWLILKLNCRLTGNTSVNRRLPSCQGPTTRQTPLISTRGTICKASQCPKLISDSLLVPTNVNIIGWLLEIYFVRKRRASLLQQLYLCGEILSQKRRSRNMSGKSCSQNNIFIQH